MFCSKYDKQTRETPCIRWGHTVYAHGLQLIPEYSLRPYYTRAPAYPGAILRLFEFVTLHTTAEMSSRAPQYSEYWFAH